MANSLSDEIRACVAAMRELEAKSTPGPWQVRFIYRMFKAARADPGLYVGTKETQDLHDAEVIVAARNTLLAQVKVMKIVANLLENQVGIYFSLEAAAAAWCKSVREATEVPNG